MEKHPHNCAFWSTLLVECLPIFCFPNHRRIDNGSLWYTHVIPYTNLQWQIKEISSTLRSNIPFQPPFSMEQNKPCVLMWARKCVSYLRRKKNVYKSCTAWPVAIPSSKGKMHMANGPRRLKQKSMTFSLNPYPSPRKKNQFGRKCVLHFHSLWLIWHGQDIAGQGPIQDFALDVQI